MLVCRPFSCIFGYVTLVISVRNAVVSVRFNISEHTKTYVISVRIAVVSGLACCRMRIAGAI